MGREREQGLNPSSPPPFLPERWDFLPGGSRKLRDGGPGGLTFMILGGFQDFWAGKCAFLRFPLFFAPKRFFAHFSLQNAKIGHGPGTLLQTMLFQYFWAPFSQKGKKGRFLRFGAVFSLLCAEFRFFRPKTGKSQKCGKIGKLPFTKRYYSSPKPGPSIFCGFGALFRFGAFWAQKVVRKRKMGEISLFCVQKRKSRTFAILAQKTCPERYVYKGFCAPGEMGENAVFRNFPLKKHFHVWRQKIFSVFFCAERELFGRKKHISGIIEFPRKYQ